MPSAALARSDSQRARTEQLKAAYGGGLKRSGSGNSRNGGAAGDDDALARLHEAAKPARRPARAVGRTVSAHLTFECSATVPEAGGGGQTGAAAAPALDAIAERAARDAKTPPAPAGQTVAEAAAQARWRKAATTVARHRSVRIDGDAAEKDGAMAMLAPKKLSQEEVEALVDRLHPHPGLPPTVRALSLGPDRTTSTAQASPTNNSSSDAGAPQHALPRTIRGARASSRTALDRVAEDSPRGAANLTDPGALDVIRVAVEERRRAEAARARAREELERAEAERRDAEAALARAQEAAAAERSMAEERRKAAEAEQARLAEARAAEEARLREEEAARAAEEERAHAAAEAARAEMQERAAAEARRAEEEARRAREAAAAEVQRAQAEREAAEREWRAAEAQAAAERKRLEEEARAEEARLERERAEAQRHLEAAREAAAVAARVAEEQRQLMEMKEAAERTRREVEAAREAAAAELKAAQAELVAADEKRKLAEAERRRAAELARAAEADAAAAAAEADALASKAESSGPGSRPSMESQTTDGGPQRNPLLIASLSPTGAASQLEDSLATQAPEEEVLSGKLPAFVQLKVGGQIVEARVLTLLSAGTQSWFWNVFVDGDWRVHADHEGRVLVDRCPHGRVDPSGLRHALHFLDQSERVSELPLPSGTTPARLLLPRDRAELRKVLSTAKVLKLDAVHEAVVAALAEDAHGARAAPRPDTVADYARTVLGMADPEAERDLLYIAEWALAAPLPAGWTSHADQDGNEYYHDASTGVSTYTHPLDGEFRAFYEKCRAVKARHDAVRESSFRGVPRTPPSSRALVASKMSLRHARTMGAEKLGAAVAAVSDSGVPQPPLARGATVGPGGFSASRVLAKVRSVVALDPLQEFAEATPRPAAPVRSSSSMASTRMRSWMEKEASRLSAMAGMSREDMQQELAEQQRLHADRVARRAGAMASSRHKEAALERHASTLGGDMRNALPVGGSVGRRG
ncbi:unnamed protein product [Pedinophyceae sp. YPF-701]|nr:unnamed protein product [Pedinophyceae sp. YPF-701]